jgi:hypothetical protein
VDEEIVAAKADFGLTPNLLDGGSSRRPRNEEAALRDHKKDDKKTVER